MKDFRVLRIIYPRDYDVRLPPWVQIPSQVMDVSVNYFPTILL